MNTQEVRSALRATITRYGTFEQAPWESIDPFLKFGQMSRAGLRAVITRFGTFEATPWSEIDPFLKIDQQPWETAAPMLPRGLAPLAPVATQPMVPLTAPGVRTFTPKPTPPSEDNVSLLGSIAKVAAGAAGGLIGGPTGAAIGVKLASIGEQALARRPSAPAVPSYAAPAATAGYGTMPSMPTMGFALPSLPTIARGAAALIPGAAGFAAGVATRAATGGCNCNGSRNGRDPCTHQKTRGGGAMDATFFGGCCPPGYVLRRRSWGRDICARQSRMNVLNPRALARADRRVTGFARRATPMLRDMGFTVSRTRHVKVKVGRKRRRG